MYQCYVIPGNAAFLVILYEGNSGVLHDLFVIVKSLLSHCTECVFLLLLR